MERQNNSRHIVGLTGKNAAGKGEVAEILKQHGYTYFSLSDVLRDEALKQGREPSREVLIALGEDLRKEGGPGVLAEKTIAKLKSGNYVIDSIRHPAEIDLLVKAGTFLLFGIDAPIKLRFDRASKRGRNENASTLEDFQKMEQRETSKNSQAQQLDLVFKRVDITIRNSSTLEKLATQVEKIIGEQSFPWN